MGRLALIRERGREGSLPTPNEQPLTFILSPSQGERRNRRYLDAARINPTERQMIYEGNARRVYPRLDAALKAKGR